MGDPAEENDPPPESIFFSQIARTESTKKLQNLHNCFFTSKPTTRSMPLAMPQSAR